jgi:hypothetical protein
MSSSGLGIPDTAIHGPPLRASPRAPWGMAVCSPYWVGVGLEAFKLLPWADWERRAWARSRCQRRAEMPRGIQPLTRCDCERAAAARPGGWAQRRGRRPGPDDAGVVGESGDAPEAQLGQRREPGPPASPHHALNTGRSSPSLRCQPWPTVTYRCVWQARKKGWAAVGPPPGPPARRNPAAGPTPAEGPPPAGCDSDRPVPRETERRLEPAV